MEITKCEAARKQQDQAAYDTVKQLPSLAKEINTNAFSVLMKNDGWSFLCMSSLCFGTKLEGFFCLSLFARIVKSYVTMYFLGDLTDL